MKYSKNIHEHLSNISVVSKNLFFAMAFMLVSSFAFSNEINKINELVKLDTFTQDTCTITVSGEDEWGCYFSHSYSFTGDISYDECVALKVVIGILLLVGQYL